MELEGWRRVGEGWRVGAAENKQNWRVCEGSGRHSRIRRTGGVEGEAPGLGRAGWHPNLNLAN